MDNIDLQVMRQVAQWHEAGHGVVMATITRTWGSAPRPPGSIVAIRDDGLITGSVSGGCIEDDLIDKARQGVLAEGRPRVVRYGIDADAAHRFGLPCGGLIELVLEPIHAGSRLPELLARLERGERVRRVLTLSTGLAALCALALLAASEAIAHGRLPGTAGLVALVVPLVLAGLSFGITHPTTIVMYLHPLPHIAGTASALGASFQTITGALFAWLAAALYDGTPLALGYCCLITLGGSFLAFQLIAKRHAPA